VNFIHVFEKVKCKILENLFLSLYLLTVTLGWVVSGFLSINRVPINWWQYKDDGVITLSHAINYLNFGIIGVSPSGPRVEGFSSPIQFVLSYLFFKFINSDYKNYIDAFIVINFVFHSVIVGLIIKKLIQLIFDNKSVKNTYFIAALSSLSFGMILVNFWSYFSWSISGLENPLIVSILLLILNEFINQQIESRNSINLLAFYLILLAIARIEFSVLIVILILVFSITKSQNSLVKTEKAIFGETFLKVIIPLFIFHIFRFLYFGSIYPSTATVQDKRFTLINLVLLLIFLLDAYLIGKLKLGNYIKTFYSKWSINFLSTIFIMGVIIISSQQKIAIILAFIYFIFKLNVLLMTKNNSINYVLLGIVYFFISQFLIFGPARLDPVRVLINIFPFLLLFSFLVIYSVTNQISKIFNDRSKSEKFKFYSITMSILILTLFLNYFFTKFNKPFDLPWTISPSEEVILEVSNNLVTQFYSEDVYPLVANPDLGKLSFSKKINVLDLGYIGSPLIKKLSEEYPEKLNLYLNNVARPDVVQLHGGWSCLYFDWVNTLEFQENYTPVLEVTQKDDFISNFNCAFNSEYMIWVRNDVENELMFSVELLRSQNIFNMIRNELTSCKEKNGDIFRCTYVSRSLYRIRPYLESKYDLKKFTPVLLDSPTYRMDSTFLLNEKNWESIVLDFLISSEKRNS
jgi:hypothetical protein